MTDQTSRSTQEVKKKPTPVNVKEEEQANTDFDLASQSGPQFGVGGDAPTIQQVASQVRQTWGAAARQRSFSSLQRKLGNQSAGHIATELSRSRADGAVLQRHLEGVPLVPEAPKAVANIEQARAGVAPPPAPARTGEEDTAAPAPAAPGPADAAPAPAPTPADPAAAPGPAPADPVAAPAPAPADPAAAAPTPAPAPVLGGSMTVAFAQQALTDTFGTVAPSAIIPGNMTVVPDMATLYAAYDQWCIDNGVTHADGSAWAAGDKLAEDTAGGFRMNAFAEPSPGTSIWVDATGSDPTATVHEMLHINTAADFRAAVGEIVNEGTTQRLAMQAVQAAGASVVGSENTYQQEQAVVEALAGKVGSDTITNAYFNGAATLTSAYDTAMGAGSWAMLKALLDANDFAGGLALINAPAPAPAAPAPAPAAPAPAAPAPAAPVPGP